MGLANTRFADWLTCANVRAGVVVEVATLVVKSGERLPELKLVTVPEPVPTATPLTNNPVALMVPKPSAPPVGEPTVMPLEVLTESWLPVTCVETEAELVPS